MEWPFCPRDSIVFLVRRCASRPANPLSFPRLRPPFLLIHTCKKRTFAQRTVARLSKNSWSLVCLYDSVQQGAAPLTMRFREPTETAVHLTVSRPRFWCKRGIVHVPPRRSMETRLCSMPASYTKTNARDACVVLWSNDDVHALKGSDSTNRVAPDVKGMRGYWSNYYFCIPHGEQPTDLSDPPLLLLQRGWRMDVTIFFSFFQWAVSAEGVQTTISAGGEGSRDHHGSGPGHVYPGR